MVSYEDLVMTNLSRVTISLQEQHFDHAFYSESHDLLFTSSNFT